MSEPRLADVVYALDRLYDPATAASWDRVGLVTGDRDQPVRRILFAVDPTQQVIAQAADWGADLLVTHHPLLLRGVHAVATDHPKGRAVTTLVRGGIALYVAHTNADVADPGVSDALGAAVGLVDLSPLVPLPDPARLKLVTFVPHDAVDRVVDTLSQSGAGVIGAYQRCAWTTDGTGTFRAGPDASPVVGSVGEVARVPEARVEMVLPARSAAAVVAALRAVHPYEEPAYDLLGLAEQPGRRGTGRVGRLPQPMPLRRFVEELVVPGLPATESGVRVAGDPEQLVETVAVCGGAGDDLFEDVRRRGVDAFLTADLRHHPASEAREWGRPALIDCPHWATEWPWLRQAEAELRAALGDAAATVETRISQIVTDPWNAWVNLTAKESR